MKDDKHIHNAAVVQSWCSSNGITVRVLSKGCTIESIIMRICHVYVADDITGMRRVSEADKGA
jgi:hypothetical protein